MDLVLKGCVGAAVTIAIALVSRTKFYFLAGLLPLFPVFAVIAHFIAVGEVGVQGLRQVALFGIWSLVPYFAYLVGIYFLSEKFAFKYALLMSLLLWCVSSVLIIFLWGIYKR